MGKTAESTKQELTPAQEIVRELESLPAGTILTNDEVLSYINRLPRRPSSWTSADVIRELRGPLPEDDPAFDHDRRR